MINMKSLDKLVEHIHEHEALLLARDVDIEHRELMALAAKEIKRYSIDPLVEENEKLRELVRDMMGFFEDGDWCVKCERARDCQAQEQYEDECLMRFVFRDRMRELGIEVS